MEKPKASREEFNDLVVDIINRNMEWKKQIVLLNSLISLEMHEISKEEQLIQKNLEQ